MRLMTTLFLLMLSIILPACTSIEERQVIRYLSIAGHRPAYAHVNPDGTCHVHFRDSDIADLTLLKDIPSPLKVLHLHDCPRVQDLSPLHDTPVKRLRLDRVGIHDLSQLKGLHLENLDIWNCAEVKDLNPLETMPLLTLGIRSAPVEDLGPLKGLSLHGLILWDTKVKDLSPLKGMQLRSLWLDGGMTDLSPIQGMPLEILWLKGSEVSDLTPLAGMPLKRLRLENCPNVTDLTPLGGAPLKEIFFEPGRISKGTEAIREMKTLIWIVDYSRKVVYDYANPKEFWEKFDAGEFKQEREGE